MDQYEQEFEAFQSGKYKESAQNWLQSSWQGDALQVGHLYSFITPSARLFVHLTIHSFFIQPLSITYSHL